MSTTQPRTPTLAEFKRLAKDIAPAARAVLMARAHAQLERERVDQYIRPIFDSYKFTYGAKYCDRHNDQEYAGRLIADPAHLYLCDDEPMLTCYYADCDAAHRAHGFTGPEGHCPALTAENLVCRVEGMLIDLAADLFGIKSADLYGENRAKYLELLLGVAQAAHGYQLTAVVESHGNSCHSRSATITVYDGQGDEVDEDVRELIAEPLRAFMDWIYDSINAEYDYQTSDEAVEENIRANEYAFTEDGARSVVVA